MSITSEVERINSNVASTYSNLEGLGADMPSEQNTDNLPETVVSIKAVRYDAQTLTEEQQTQARTNIGALGKADISLGIASDGLMYIFLNGEPVGTGIAQGQSGDVFGYVDENNTIVLKGNLSNDTYSFKYEMDNGDVIDIGDAVLDSTVYYSVTSNLTDCTSSNSTKSIAEGESYSATISVNDGYALSSVVVTMGGTDISSTAVSGNTISIASVTGDIVITAVAEEVVTEPSYTNLAEPNTTNTTDWSIWCNNSRISSGGEYRSATGQSTTNYIEASIGDTLYVKGLSFTADTHSICSYNSSKAKVNIGTPTYWHANGFGRIENLENGVMSITIKDVSANSNTAFIRFSAALTGTVNDVIITKNQPID